MPLVQFAFLCAITFGAISALAPAGTALAGPLAAAFGTATVLTVGGGPSSP